MKLNFILTPVIGVVKSDVIFHPGSSPLQTLGFIIWEVNAEVLRWSLFSHAASMEVMSHFWLEWMTHSRYDASQNISSWRQIWRKGWIVQEKLFLQVQWNTLEQRKIRDGRITWTDHLMPRTLLLNNEQLKTLTSIKLFTIEIALWSKSHVG